VSRKLSEQEREKGNPYVSNKLCIARMETLTEKINGLQRTFIVGLSISTILIGVFQVLLEFVI